MKPGASALPLTVPAPSSDQGPGNPPEDLPRFRSGGPWEIIRQRHDEAVVWRRFPGRCEVPLALSQAEFNNLVEEHASALYRMAYRLVGNQHEAEDFVQETFRSAWKSRQNYQAGLTDRAWLASILRRRVIDVWRKHPAPRVTDSGDELEIPVRAYDPTDDEYTDEMQHALNQLPPDWKECLLLVVVAELTHQEAADLLSIPIGTVLSRVSRARRRLRDLLIAAKAH